MKKYLFGLLCAIAFFSSCQRKCELNIASYNLLFEWKIPEQDDRKWVNRKDNVLAIFEKYNLDIIGTQEALSFQVDEIVAESPYGRVGGDLAKGEKVGRRAENEAIFYRRDRFEVLDEGNFWFSETPDTPGTYSWGMEYPRMCSWGKFKDKRSGVEFYVFNSHFYVNNPRSRKEAASMVLQRIKAVAGEYPVFCTGDLNSTDNEESIQILLSDGTLRDSYKIASKITGPYFTFHGFRAEPPKDRRIDYVMVNDKVQVNSYHVADDDLQGKGYASDHLPVIVNVSIQ